jgi:anaerobic selenocysteine-containing dehydrogenase
MGKAAYLLPCFSRIERDVQATGPQTVSTEDSTSCIHASFGDHEPASPNLRSEPAIVAGLAQATLAANPKVPWAAWTADYSLVRDAIERTYPQFFRDFNKRFHAPGGFWKGNKASERDFSDAPGGMANFVKPTALSATGFEDAPGLLRLMTLRSNDQFNTTIYGYEDRLRGLSGSREVLLINERDMRRLGLVEGQRVSLECTIDDGVPRRKDGLTVTPYETPDGCVGGYYPELNLLIPLSHYAEESKTPAAKSVPVRVVVSPADPTS